MVFLKAIYENQSEPYPDEFEQPDLATAFAAFERVRMAHAIDGRRLKVLWLFDNQTKQGLVLKCCGMTPTDPLSETTEHDAWGDEDA
jgi:hypothetical protein